MIHRRNYLLVILLFSLFILPGYSPGTPLMLYPQQLSLAVNTSATVTATFDNQPVIVAWSLSDVMGNIGSLSHTSGSSTLLQTSNLPALGNIIAVFGTDSASIPVEVGKIDLLKKVIDNSAKITSLIATLSTTMTILPATYTQSYTSKLIYKSPDKLKAILFDQQHKPLQTQIYQDKYMTLLDSEGRKWTKDITGYIQELNLPNFMFQIDLNRFLDEHQLKFNSELSTPAVFSYCLEARPIQQNDYYSKIRLVIDYDKGMILNQEMSSAEREDEIISRYEVIELELRDGIWIGKKMRMKQHQLGYEIVNEIVYDEVGINEEVGEEEF